MLKILFFALAAGVPAASACAALVRASGHKARAVDATLLTKADREVADVLFTSADADALVHAAYDDKPVFVVSEFLPAEFLPERVAAVVAFLNGEGEAPSFGVPMGSGAAKVEPDANGDGKVTAAEMKAALTAKGIEFKGNASKAELQALLAQAN